MSIFAVDKLITEARRLALEYRQATGKVLPITAEIAINDAIRLLDLTAAERGTQGYDATMEKNAESLKVQIKGRAILQENKSGHRLGQLKMEQAWDAIVLVIMNDVFETEEIYFCHRNDIEDEISSTSENKRGSFTLAKFKIIADLIWTVENGLEKNEYWSNQND